MISTLRRLFAGILIGALAWGIGLVWFVVDLDRFKPDPQTRTDAIVVLTGGSQRLERGLALLRDGLAKKLFISGVHQQVAETEIERLAHVDKDLMACCIVLGHAADNTEGNARETAAWLLDERYESIRLVTANYHMRRALLEFRRLLPPGTLIVPDAVIPEAAQHGSFWSWRGTSPVVALEYTKFLGAWLRAAVFPPGTAPAMTSSAA